MKCPHCGYPIQNGKRRCPRCGREYKRTTEDRQCSDGPEKRTGNEKVPEVIELDPSKVSIQKKRPQKTGRRRRSGIMDDIFGGGLFGGLFGDVFGGIFDVFGEEDDDTPQAYDDFGDPIPYDIYDRDFIEIRDYEIIEDDDRKKRRHGKNDK